MKEQMGIGNIGVKTLERNYFLIICQPPRTAGSPAERAEHYSLVRQRNAKVGEWCSCHRILSLFEYYLRRAHGVLEPGAPA